MSEMNRDGRLSITQPLAGRMKYVEAYFIKGRTQMFEVAGW